MALWKKLKVCLYLLKVTHCKSYKVPPAIWNHTVLPAIWHSWPCPALTPAMQAGTRFTHPRGMEGWVDLSVGYKPRWFTCLQTVTHPSSNHLIATRLGVEPTALFLNSNVHCHCERSSSSFDECSTSTQSGWTCHSDSAYCQITSVPFIITRLKSDWHMKDVDETQPNMWAQCQTVSRLQYMDHGSGLTMISYKAKLFHASM